MPSAKTAPRDVKTRTTGVYRDTATGLYMARWGKSGKARGFQTEAAAKKHRAKMLLKPQRSGAHLPTFKAYAEDWISSYRGRAGRGIEELTRQDYRDNLKRNAYKTLGSVRLDRIDAPMLRGFVADLDARGLSHNTIRLAFAPVRLALTQAFDDGLVNPNPAAGIKTQGAKRRKSREKRTMTREQFIAFIAAISDPGDRLLVRFALETRAAHF